MVNANIIISVSAVLVAVILTIVFVMRKNGDPTDNFSVSVGGTIDGKPAGMYYCIGQSCQFYGSLPAATPDFPGYFALVGFTIEGDTYLTEHSIGKTFKFDGAGTLTACFDAAPLDSTDLSTRVAALKASNTGDGTYTIGGNTFKQTSYSLSKDPASDSPKVLGLSVPSVEACKAVWFVEGVDHHDITEVGPETGFDGSAVAPVHVRHLSGERMLWNSGVANLQSAAWARQSAGMAYNGVGDGNHIVWNSCIVNTPFSSSAVSRFIYDSGGNTMAISFAGSNDAYDWILDLTQSGSGSPADLHWGFWTYVNLLSGCTNNYVNQLWGWGIDIDMIVGHSLGGAAAVVYKKLFSGNNGIRNAVLDTWAGPKTTRYTSCTWGGNRRFDEKDPVSGNGMGLMSNFNHDVKNAQKGWQGSECSSSFWGVCYSWRTSYNVAGVGCGENSGGCSWVADCAYNVGRHSLSSYANYPF